MAYDHPSFRQFALTAATLALFAAGCGGPRIKMLTSEKYPALPSAAKVDVYVGELASANQPVAIIESKAYGILDDTVKQQQLEQLRQRARKLGANAIDNVHILPLRVQRFTVDSQAPVQAYQQGRTELYFMRATAVRVPEAAAAATTATQVSAPTAAKPQGPATEPAGGEPVGSVVEKLAPPKPLAPAQVTTGTTATAPAAPAPLPAPQVQATTASATQNLPLPPPPPPLTPDETK